MIESEFYEISQYSSILNNFLAQSFIKVKFYDKKLDTYIINYKNIVNLCKISLKYYWKIFT